MTDSERIFKLTHPGRPLHLVIDSDTAAEVDDQFAISYAIRSAEAGELTLEAVYAAPFPYDWDNIDPKKGVEASYEEIGRVIAHCKTALDIPVFKGSERYMKNGGPVDSAAVRDLIERAMARPEDDPLYVISIGTITNIGSALALEPRLADHLVVCFLGGNSLSFPHVREYNLGQDHDAFNTVASSGVPLILFPARTAVSHLVTSIPELEHFLAGKSEIADYLLSIVKSYGERHRRPGEAWSKVVWDIAGVAYAMHPEWFESSLAPTVTVSEDHHWIVDRTRPPMRVIDFVWRDPVFTDLFRKLAK